MGYPAAYLPLLERGAGGANTGLRVSGTRVWNLRSIRTGLSDPNDEP